VNGVANPNIIESNPLPKLASSLFFVHYKNCIVTKGVFDWGKCSTNNPI